MERSSLGLLRGKVNQRTTLCTQPRRVAYVQQQKDAQRTTSRLSCLANSIIRQSDSEDAKNCVASHHITSYKDSTCAPTLVLEHAATTCPRQPTLLESLLSTTKAAMATIYPWTTGPSRNNLSGSFQFAGMNNLRNNAMTVHNKQKLLWHAAIDLAWAQADHAQRNDIRAFCARWRPR